MHELKQTQAINNEDKARLKMLKTSESRQVNVTFDMNGVKAVPPPKLG